MSRVCVIVPFRSDGGQRDRLLAWMLKQVGQDHPEWGTVVGRSPDGPFNRAAAILDGAKRTKADILVIADADVWCNVDAAVEAAQTHAFAVPHWLLHRLSAESTERVLAGEDWHGLPLSQDNTQDKRPYRGNETGTLVVMRRDVLEAVPPDPRFVGWGSEDEAWGIALRTLIGQPWRGRLDLPHLWHEAQPRMNRRVGSSESQGLLGRYQRARGSRERVGALIAEVHALV